MSSSRFAGVFKAKNVLITGGTGFVGTVIVEKLLRTFKDVGRIYLVVRNKQQRSAQNRVQEYFNNPLFDRMKIENPNYHTQVKWIEGDINENGIDDAYLDEVKDEVNLVIHSAASVKLDDLLANTMKTNLRGTYKILQISKDIKNLESFLYVSTSYCNARASNARLEERIYPHPIKPRELLRLLELNGDDFINRRRKALVQDWINTYTYIKNATENLVQEYEREFPVGIFRPSLVSPIYREPLPGWMQGKASIIGLVLAFHTGDIKVAYANPQNRLHLIPADMTANAALAVTAKIALEQKKCVGVYNYTPNKAVTIDEMLQYIYAKNNQTFNTKSVIKRNNMEFILAHLYKHTIPAYIDDLVKVLRGAKGSSVRRYKILDAFLKHSSGFLLTDYNFDNGNINALWDEMSEEDRAMLFFDLSEIDWKSYCGGFVIGMERYVLR